MKTWIGGIDFLRAFMSVCVVALHMVLFGTSSIFDKNYYETHVFTPSDLLNFHVLMLAVPTFILISCYLRATKTPNVMDFWKQIHRLILLSVFWSACSLLWANGARRGLQVVVPRSSHDLLVLFLSSGHTEYYFFVSLAIVSLR